MILIPYRDVLLVKESKSFWAKVVKMFVKDKNGYVHSEYVIDHWLTVGTDLSCPVAVRPFGYNIKEVDIWRLKNEVSESQKEMLIESIQKLSKRKYDWVEAVSLGLFKKGEGAKDRYICITLITKAMEDAGILPKDTHKVYRGFTVFTDSGFFYKV